MAIKRLFLTGPRAYSGSPAVMYLPTPVLDLFGDAGLSDKPMLALRKVPLGVSLHILKKYEYLPAPGTPPQVWCRLRKRGKLGSLVVLPPRGMKLLKIYWADAHFRVEETPSGIRVRTYQPLAETAVNPASGKFPYPVVAVMEPNRRPAASRDVPEFT